MKEARTAGCRAGPAYLIRLAALSLLLPAAALPDVIRVPEDRGTVQAAIDAASGGDTVLVGPGTYLEHLDFKGKALRVRSTHGSRATVLDGSRPSVPDGGRPSDPKQGSVVRFTRGEGPEAVLEGFTLTRGYARDGGGIFCSGSSPTIVNNRILWNRVDFNGGGIWCTDGASPLIRGNTIAGNFANDSGGGICSFKSSPRIEENVIFGNRARHRGGGIRINHERFEVLRNVIYRNRAAVGGGISLGNDASVVAGNMIFANTAEKYGGGIYCFKSRPVIMRCTLWRNAAAERGGAVCCDFDSRAEVTHSILWENDGPAGPELWIGSPGHPSSLAISHCDVKGGKASVLAAGGAGLEWGRGMIREDPRFAAPGEMDLHLLYGSPCRDAGRGGAPGLPAEDFEGDPSPAGGGADLGADEFHPRLYHTGEARWGGMIRVKLVAPPGTVPAACWVDPGILPGFRRFQGLPWPWTAVYLMDPLEPVPAEGLKEVRLYLPALPLSIDSVPLRGMAGRAGTNPLSVEAR